MCFLYEGEINNGGIDLVFNCVGLLIPEIVRGLAYFGAHQYSRSLSDLISELELTEFPRSHDALMEAWDAWYTESRYYTYVRPVELSYDSLEPTHSLVEERIRAAPNLFLRNPDLL